jgi:hypothetical protein
MEPWTRLHNEFHALMEEEDRIIQQRDLRDRFHGEVFYGENSGECGSWSLVNSATESLQVRFELLATEAGIALGSPPETLPLFYWLHCLFVDLRANHSQHIRTYDTDLGNDTVGSIEGLLEASATFCSRLDRRSLEKAVMSPADLAEAKPRKPPRSAADGAEPVIPPSARRGPKPDYDTALRVAEIVARLAGDGKWRSNLDDICLELDENAVRFPKTWTARGYRNWVDGFSSQRDLVEKAIAHHLRLASRHRQTFS